MITVHLPTDLSAAFAVHPTLQLDAATLGDLVITLEGRHPGMASWITESGGQFRRHLTVFVAGRRLAQANASTHIPENADVWILRAVSGG